MITISKEKKKTLHIASCSFGKDSLATILLALEHGEPLDEAVYCEVMFDKRTSGGWDGAYSPAERSNARTEGIRAEVLFSDRG